MARLAPCSLNPHAFRGVVCGAGLCNRARNAPERVTSQNGEEKMKIWKTLFGRKNTNQSEKQEDSTFTGETNPEGTIKAPNSLFGRAGNNRYINPKDTSNPANPFSSNKRDRF